MPFFKTTNNIVTDHGEHFDENWMDSDTLILPPKDEWTYDRELTIDDIDLWEVIFEDNFGIYAAYSPHAEFYMIFPFYWVKDQGFEIETFYGVDAADRTWKRAKELGMTLPVTEYYLPNEQFDKYIKS
tara:strand:+ start:4343 stop:4726 length:384 start_codon:yes stop_codon:yes gene_type:complete